MACQTVNIYDLRYSENPFECPGMLICLGVVLALFVLIVTAAICHYIYAKYRRPLKVIRKQKQVNSLYMENIWNTDINKIKPKLKKTRHLGDFIIRV